MLKFDLKFPDGTIKSIVCKLNSGIADCNGKEIFEGDRVKFKGETFNVEFDGDNFIFTNGGTDCYELHLYANDIEVVGHVDVDD